MTNTLQPVTPAVDAFDVDAPAAAQLAKDVPNATVVRTDGCTYIRFDSRDDFLKACAAGVIQLDNPFLLHTVGRDVVGPVLFGHGGQWRWEATAVYPAQNPCDCGAEVTHQLGCSAVEYPEPAMFADIPVLVIDVPRHTPVAGIVTHYPVLSGYGAMCGQHPDSLTRNPDRVTCPDCAVMLPTPEELPRRTPGAALVDNPAPVEPMTRFLRDAYSPKRAAEARELASVLIEEKAE